MGSFWVVSALTLIISATKKEGHIFSSSLRMTVYYEMVLYFQLPCRDDAILKVFGKVLQIFSYLRASMLCSNFSGGN